MSDNTTLNVGASGDVIATKDISGVKHQEVLLEYNAAAPQVVDATHGLPVRPAACSTATLSNVSGSAISVSLLGSTAGRLGLLLFNDSTAILSLKYGTTASATSFTVQIPAGGYWEMPTPIYTGAIDGIWSAAAGAVRLTELT